MSLCNIKNIHNVILGIINDKIPCDTYNLSDKNHYSYNELLSLKSIDKSFKIPVFLIKLLYYVGKITDNIFLIENSIKLMSNNLFPSKKIQKFIEIKFSLTK